MAPSDSDNPPDVADPVVPLMPPPPARIIGRICAAGHERISHTEKFCPLCVARALCVQTMSEKDALEQHVVLVAERMQLLTGERHMLTNKLFEMRQTMIELGPTMKSCYVKNKPRGHIVGSQWTLMTGDGKKEPRRALVLSVDARVVRVIVAPNEHVGHWSDPHIGTEQMAVEVHLTTADVDETFYLDNMDGLTPFKMTIGHGDPRLGLRQLQIDKVVDDPTIQQTYQCHLSATTKAARSDKPTQFSGPSYYCSWLPSPLRFSR